MSALQSLLQAVGGAHGHSGSAILAALLGQPGLQLGGDDEDEEYDGMNEDDEDWEEEGEWVEDSDMDSFDDDDDEDDEDEVRANTHDHAGKYIWLGFY